MKQSNELSIEGEERQKHHPMREERKMS